VDASASADRAHAHASDDFRPRPPRIDTRLLTQDDAGVLAPSVVCPAFVQFASGARRSDALAFTQASIIASMRKREAILSGSTFEKDIGYARAVADGDWVHVSGTTGFDYATMTISDDVVRQAEQALLNIEAALIEAGCGFADVVRVRYLLPDRKDFEPCWPVLRRYFADVQPAATMIVCGLSDARMRIEIEVTPHR